MKKLTLLIVFAFIMQATALSQSCLPEGITFSTQEQIDNFQTNYPGCTEIEGGVRISGNYINNLGGLNILIAIGGKLEIYNCDALTNLTGLDNVTSIGGDFSIEFNDVLTSLSGLDNVTYIGGYILIYNNAALHSLTGLDNVISIEGYILIEDNAALTSLTGLENIKANSITELSIYDNNSLSNCEVQSICDYLAKPNGTVNIYNNAIGCNNPPEIANSCGFTMPCLPYGNYYFHSQSEIDNLQTNYPGCTEIKGDVKINGDDITNLNGLNVLTAIGGRLWIEDNAALTSLTGLDNVTSIGGHLWIEDNAALTSSAFIN